MLSTKEYEYFSDLIKETIHNIENGIDLKNDNPYVGYWNHTAKWTSPVDVVNISLYNRNDNVIKHEFDIWIDRITIYSHFDINYNVVGVFSTEPFLDNSDEAFFQGSMIEDTSILETDFLRSLIKLSLLLRENYNVSQK